MLPDNNQRLTPAQRQAQLLHPPGEPAYYNQADYEEDPGPGILDYYRILRRRKGTVALIAFLGLLLGVLITLPQTPVYEARTTLEIQDLNQDFMNMRQMNPVSDSGPGYSALSDIQTQIRILQSETLAEAVIAKLKLKAEDGLKPPSSRLEAWRKALNLPQPAPPDSNRPLLAQIAADLKVKNVPQTRIIDVTAESTDPALAARFANTLANEYIDQNMRARWQMTQRTGDWLAHQLDDMRVRLERSEDALQAYARQSGLMFTSEKENVSEVKLRQLQEALSAAQADRVARQSRYEMAVRAPLETLPEVLDNDSLRDLQSRLTDLRRQEAELAAIYKPEYSRVRRIHAQVATLEAALVRERKALLDRITSAYHEARGREKLLAADYANQARLVTTEAEKSIQYNILKREVDSNRQLYEAMLQRVKESSIASAMKASNVRVVDAAKIPRFPAKPSLPLNATLGLLAGCFFGVAAVILRERADRTLQQPGDASFYVNLTELGAIPSANAARKRLYYYRRKRLPAAEPSTALVSTAGGEPLPERVELVTWQKKPSLAAESFRVVLTSILFSCENGSRPKVLVTTSPGPAEGKTTVASNLAIAMAEIGRKVLLIDADLRKPKIYDIFQVSNEAGLSTLLRQPEVAGPAADACVFATAVPNLSVMPSGPATAAAANLLFSKSMQALIARFRQEYDMVLIDTPPMLQMPDARVVGRQADSVLLILRANHTTRDAALAARQRFAEDQTHLLGTILNDWNPRQTAGGYYSYYRGYHYYAQSYAKYEQS